MLPYPVRGIRALKRARCHARSTKKYCRTKKRTSVDGLLVTTGEEKNHRHFLLQNEMPNEFDFWTVLGNYKSFRAVAVI